MTKTEKVLIAIILVGIGIIAYLCLRPTPAPPPSIINTSVQDSLKIENTSLKENINEKNKQLAIIQSTRDSVRVKYRVIYKEREARGEAVPDSLKLSECEETLSLCDTFVVVQKEIINTKDTIIANLETSLDVTTTQRDSIHTSEVDLKLDLVKEKNAKKAWIKGGIGIIIVETLIIFFSR